MRQALVLRVKCLDLLFRSSTQTSRANVNQATTTSSAASSLMKWRDLPRDNGLWVTPTAINLDCRYLVLYMLEPLHGLTSFSTNSVTLQYA
jgi:hypothetical protein